jgi:DNA-binding MarR family transcriptional regulator
MPYVCWAWGKSPSVVDQAPKTPAGKLNEASLHRLVGYQLAQAAITMTAVFDQRAREVADVRPVEFTLLCLIAENPDVSSARLAKALAVTKPNITMWVDRLEARGLVARRPSKTDKRSIELKTTNAGKKLAKSVGQGLLAGEAAALGTLSTQEHAMLIDLLYKVASNRPV